MKELDVLGSQLAHLSVRQAVFQRASEALAQWRGRARVLITSPPDIETWPNAAGGTDPLEDVRALATHAVTLVENATADVDRALTALEDVAAVTGSEVSRLDEQARELRRRAEELQEGAGAAARRLAELQQADGQISAFVELLKQRRARHEEIRRERSAALDELDAVREIRFRERADIGVWLTAELGPVIDIEVIRSGLQSDYASAIAAALRGSGLHYTKLAPQLASRMSPRELIEAVERDDYETIAQLGGIPDDRARRLIDHINAQGAGDLAAAPVDDAVTLRLLDGTGYKETGEMSTGQRCTVVLPILLRHSDQPLVVDQPEDHLDNAFIVGTLIHAIRTRPENSQLIVSTHNPNIPVLGEASRVVVLDSDGRRGFIRCDGPLDDSDVVTSITSIMEGGREAFARRASFYAVELEPQFGSQ
jgi:hypothetical protein